jgi:hypothetical protein
MAFDAWFAPPAMQAESGTGALGGKPPFPGQRLWCDMVPFVRESEYMLVIDYNQLLSFNIINDSS